MYGSFYLVLFDPEEFGPKQLHLKVEAGTMLEVEDWAHEIANNDLNGKYNLRSITKEYAYSTHEYEMFGETDVKLDRITETFKTERTEQLKALTTELLG
jgi:hypothetical protein